MGMHPQPGMLDYMSYTVAVLPQAHRNPQEGRLLMGRCFEIGQAGLSLPSAIYFSTLPHKPLTRCWLWQYNIFKRHAEEHSECHTCRRPFSGVAQQRDFIEEQVQPACQHV